MLLGVIPSIRISSKKILICAKLINKNNQKLWIGCIFNLINKKMSSPN